MINPEEKCAVFLDIDGTLICGNGKMPEENRKAISAARAKGHLVFINTGRSRGNIPDDFIDQFDVDGIIAGSGAMIIMNGEVSYASSMSRELVRRITGYAFRHPEFWYMLEGLNKVYIIPNSERNASSHHIQLRNADDVEAMLEKDEVQVLAMGVKVPEDFKEKFRNELDVFQFDTYADCVIKGTNKATGIEKVLELTGIKRENTIAIGDSNNDLDMIKYAGVGVAMANSQQSVLDAADYITDSVEDCGVAKAISKFLL